MQTEHIVLFKKGNIVQPRQPILCTSLCDLIVQYEHFHPLQALTPAYYQPTA
mgnify:CR=1 FL=1